MTSSGSLSRLLRGLPPQTVLQAELDRRRTEADRERLLRNAETIKLRCRSLLGFVREAWHVVEPDRPAYVHGWHIEAVCAHLEAITFGRFLDMGLENRLLINEPYGMMKSLLVAVLWPAWEWGPCDMAWLRYLTASYRDDYATRDARRTRDLIASEWYQTLWGDRVKLKRSGESSFENSAGGVREAVPYKSLTAGRGDRVIIDDPHSTETAESDADRARSNRIFRESATSRLNDPEKSAIVVIMHRLHSDDVSGTILRLKLPYIHLMLPMEFEPERRCITPIFKDPRKLDGELLFPERFTRAVVDRDKLVLGSIGVAGQMQQRPSPRGGLLFKRHWFKIVDAAPAARVQVRGWDLAATEGSKAAQTQSVLGPAFTAGVLLGRDWQGQFYIEHVARAQASAREVRTMIANMGTQDGKRVEISIPQDPGQAGKAQAQEIIGGMAGWKIFATPESGDKVTRAEPVAAQAEAGNICIVKGDWNEAFLSEIETFPSGRYADQVDGLSRAFARLLQSNGGVVLAGPVVVSGGPRSIPGMAMPGSQQAREVPP